MIDITVTIIVILEAILNEELFLLTDHQREMFVSE